MTQEMITAYVKEQGYDGADYRGQWNGYDVYEPFFEGHEYGIIGYPLCILVKGSSIRMTTPEESLELLDALPDEDEDTDENETDLC